LTRPEVIAAELERLRESDPVRGDLDAIGRLAADMSRKQRNLVGQLAMTDDPDVAAIIQEELKALATQKRQLEEDQAKLEAQRDAWRLAQDQLENLDAWCRNVTANLRGITYEERRLALRAPGLEARVWRVDHDPRFEISMRLDFIDSTTHRCNAGRCRTGVAASRGHSGGTPIHYYERRGELSGAARRPPAGTGLQRRPTPPHLRPASRRR
jgi:hypothetical protein